MHNESVKIKRGCLRVLILETKFVALKNFINIQTIKNNFVPKNEKKTDLWVQ